MDQSASRGASSSSSYGGPAGKGSNESVGNALNRGKDAISNAASTAADSASSDFDNLRSDFNGLKETVTKFISQASDQASKSVREASSAVAGQVSDAATGLKESGSQLATAATEQAKTFAAELESMGRRNPLGAMAGAVLIGVLIGLMGRSRS